MTLQATVYQHLLIIFIITLFFYGLVPIIGAFSVRTRWRKFRRQLMKASLRESLTYKAVYNNGSSGLYRFFGSLQAVQGENIVWLTNGEVSVCIDLQGVPLYLLPSASRDSSTFQTSLYPDESPKKTYWNRVFSLPEKTSFFISGKLIKNGGSAQFKNDNETPLLVIIYDCDESDFYSHAILSGRQRNEYWNASTPGSLTIGSFSLFIYFYLLIQNSYMHFVAITALAFSLVPVIPFLPPGLIFYYIYRNFWKKARNLRAERDLLRLPLNYFSNQGGLSKNHSVFLANGEIYQCYIKNNLEDAMGMFNNTIFRQSSLNKSNTKIIEYFVFGTKLKGNSDPMAETLCIPGNPELLSLRATKVAQKYEVFSTLFFGLGFVLNFIIFLTIIALLIK